MITGQVEGKLNEVGLKANLLRGRVTGSVAYYEMIRNGFIQISTHVETGANGIGLVDFSEFFIAQGEKVQGLEIELFGQPTNRLTFMLAAAFQNGWKPRSNGQVQHIDTLTDEITFHGKYSFRDGNRNGFEVTAGGKYWFGGWPISPTSFVEFTEDQYQIDLGAGYYWRSGRYGVQLKVNNVLDDVIFITENSQWPLRRAFLSFSARF
jgi:outer membrane receptor for ferric coprogen and ferric-rhodotorulic acid